MSTVPISGVSLASPNHLIFSQVLTGGAAVDFITKESLVAACAAGPLKTALVAATTGPAWLELDGLNGGKAKIAIRARAFINAVPFAVAMVTSPGNGLNISHAADVSAMVEIEFLHSLTK